MSWRKQQVVPLERPAPGVSLNPDVLGGFPAIDGTRIPYDSVTALAADGLNIDGIQYLYPSIPAGSVRGALDFADYVAEYNTHGRDAEAAAG